MTERVTKADWPNAYWQNVCFRKMGYVWLLYSVQSIRVIRIWSTEISVKLGSCELTQSIGSRIAFKLVFFKKMGHFQPLFLYFCLFYKQLTVTRLNKSCRWLDSNPGPLVSEATALSTVPQPLPYKLTCLSAFRLFCIG